MKEGDLPASAQPFFGALQADAPDLEGVHFFALGLGDSSYEFYSRGIETLSEALQNAGATQMADILKHDALSGTDPALVGAEWAVASLESLTPALSR